MRLSEARAAYIKQIDEERLNRRYLALTNGKDRPPAASHPAAARARGAPVPSSLICEHCKQRSKCEECRAGGGTSRTANQKRRQQPADKSSDRAAKRRGQSGATSSEQASATPAEAAPVTVKTEVLEMEVEVEAEVEVEVAVKMEEAEELELEAEPEVRVKTEGEAEDSVAA